MSTTSVSGQEVRYSRSGYDIVAIDPHWADVKMVRMIGKDRRCLKSDARAVTSGSICEAREL